jgi:hypothetical protein
MTQPSADNRSVVGPLRAALEPVVDRQTYRNIAYLLLAFPLGLCYYVLLVFGFAFGIALSVVLVGLGVLLATVVGVRYVAAFERRLANRLLGTNIAAPDDVDREDGFVATAKAYLGASSTWRGLGFVVLKFWLGILSFVLLVAFLGTALELLLLPLVETGAFNVEVAGWEVAESFQTRTERLLAVPIGAVLGVIAVHVLNSVATASASVASALLGPSEGARAATDGRESE